MPGRSPSRGTVTNLEGRSARPSAPSRGDIEAVLIRFVFQEELLFEGLCDIPPAASKVQKRLQRTTDALMALLQIR